MLKALSGEAKIEKDPEHCEFPMQNIYEEGTKQAEDWERGYNCGLTLASLDEEVVTAPEGESKEFYEGARYGWMSYGYDD